jgi:hypothetical protein
MLEPPLKGPMFWPPVNGPMLEPEFIGPKLEPPSKGPQFDMPLPLVQPLLLLLPKKAEAEVYILSKEEVAVIRHSLTTTVHSSTLELQT